MGALKEIQQDSYPNIVEYKCYRKFLEDMYFFRKQLRPGFSYRQFSKLVGLKSPNYIQQVIEGKKNISAPTGDRLAKVLKLTNLEKAFFVGLIEKENALSQEDRENAERKLFVTAKRLASKEIPQCHFKILEEWHHIVVRELVLLDDFKATGSYISKKLHGLITEEQAEDSLSLLLKVGYLKKVNDQFLLSDPVVVTNEANFSRLQMQNFHSQLWRVWSENIGKLPAPYRELGVINIPIEKKKIALVKQKIRQFQEEIVGLLKDETKADSFIQLGTYCIPLGVDEDL